MHFCDFSNAYKYFICMSEDLLTKFNTKIKLQMIENGFIIGLFVRKVSLEKKFTFNYVFARLVKFMMIL